MRLSTDHLLTLLKTPRFGYTSVKYLNSNISYKLSDLTDLYDAVLELKGKNPRLPIPNLNDLKIAYDTARITMDNCDRLNVKAISCNDIIYPSKLKRLDDYPIIFYLKGSLESITNTHSVAIIGTREPSDFGFRAGKKIAGIFAENDFTIVSGLAVGCDTSGHLGAVEKNKPTVAVLASGVDIIYPKENKGLSERIVETGGALLSEYEPGTKTFPQQFVQRDRIQSGLADGLIVVETGIKGGTMHAVGAARKINMPLGCITGHPSHLEGFEKIKGNKMLIDDGASPLGNADQINSFMRKLYPAIQIHVSTRNDGKLITLGESEKSTTEEKPEQTINPDIRKTSMSITSFEEPGILRKEKTDDLTLDQMKDLILKLTDEQKETNKLLKTLVTQLLKDKSPKKKSDNQSSLL
jgi:DNA processing protein